MQFPQMDSAMGNMMGKLRYIKKKTKIWEQNRKKHMIRDLEQIIMDITRFGKLMEQRHPSLADWEYLSNLKD